MKHLLTAFACLFALAGGAQTCPEDLNGDGVIGTVDLLQLLDFYGEFCPEEPEEDYTLEWSLNRDACKVLWGAFGNFHIGIDCQYVWVAMPNGGINHWTNDANLRLPNELPFDEYSVHVHVQAMGQQCGSSSSSCPPLQVQTYENGAWVDFDSIYLGAFNTPSGLGVNHRTYTFLNGTWIIIADNYQQIFHEE